MIFLMKFFDTLLFCMLVLAFRDRDSLHSFGCPGTHSIDLAVLEFTEICLCLPRAGIKGVPTSAQLDTLLLNKVFIVSQFYVLI